MTPPEKLQSAEKRENRLLSAINSRERQAERDPPKKFINLLEITSRNDGVGLDYKYSENSSSIRLALIRLTELKVEQLIPMLNAITKSFDLAWIRQFFLIKMPSYYLPMKIIQH